MSKRTRKRTRGGKRETNWLVIGGIVAVGIIVIVLLALTLRDPDSSSEALSALGEYCQNNPDNCIAKGDPDAPVTIVEISDYGCGHCRDFNLETAPVLDSEYVATDDVYWIVLPYALRNETVPASASAMCAAEQDAYFEYHEKMFEYLTTPVALTPAGFLQAAGDIGLNLEEFNACLESGRNTSVIIANAEAARNAGVGVTPTFFVNDEKLEGNFPLETFRERIEAVTTGS